MGERRRIAAPALDDYLAKVRRSCFICDILASPDRTRHHIVYEDDLAIAFLDRYPTLYGHVLVAPREHREHVTGDFTEDDYVALQRVVHRVGEAVRRAVPTERLYVVSFGSQQGNRHVHWHVAPLPPGVPFEDQQGAALSWKGASSTCPRMNWPSSPSVFVGRSGLASISHMRFPVVLLDFDGTVVDSGAMILASFRHATKTVLDRDLSDAELLAAVGTPLRDQMQLIDAERADELVDVYRAHNEPLHEALEACDGMLELLRRLKGEGRRLGIVTSKRRATVELAFAVLPLRHYFDAVVTADDVKRHKPHPDPVLEALDRLDAWPEQAVYVGDAPFDVAAAKAAGVHAVAVTWGGMHSEEALRASEPDAIVSTPEELLDVL